MNLTLKVWRQRNNQAAGSLETYQVKDISSEMSFLEMFDVLNEQLIVAGDDPIAFDHDCREGICGQCSMHIDGRAHGPWTNNTTCQLHMRAFKDGDTVVVEPWRSKAFPVLKDLMVDRGAFDRIIQAGGYISVNTGNAVDANATTILNTTDLQNVTDVINNLLSIRSKVGATENRMDSAKERNLTENTNMTDMLSKTEDIDIAQKTIDYATSQTVYTAALQTSAKIIQPSLLDYLR